MGNTAEVRPYPQVLANSANIHQGQGIYQGVAGGGRPASAYQADSCICHPGGGETSSSERLLTFLIERVVGVLRELVSALVSPFRGASQSVQSPAISVPSNSVSSNSAASNSAPSNGASDTTQAVTEKKSTNSLTKMAGSWLKKGADYLLEKASPYLDKAWNWGMEKIGNFGGYLQQGLNWGLGKLGSFFF